MSEKGHTVEFTNLLSRVSEIDIHVLSLFYWAHRTYHNSAHLQICVFFSKN